MLPSAPGKVLIVNVETGKIIERWPVDARKMVACGEFRAFEDGVDGIEPPPDEAVGDESASSSDPVPHDKPPIEHSPGVPANITQSGDAGEGKPVEVVTKSKKPAKKRTPRPKKD